MENNQKKNRTLLAKQKLIILILVGAIAVLAALYFILSTVLKQELHTVYAINDKGDYVYSTVSDANGTAIGARIESMASGAEENEWDVTKHESGNILYTFRLDGAKVTERPFIFKEIPLSDIQRVTVTKKDSKLSIYDYDGNFFIEGAERNLYNQQALSELLLQARYMLASSYVDNPKKLSDYGLEKGNCTAEVSITDKSGNTETVYIGNEVMSGSGYYMKHAEKDSIYIMDSSVSALLMDVTSFLSPVVIDPIDENYRAYIEKFAIAKDGIPFFACRILSEEEQVGVYANQLHKMTYPEPEHVLSITTLYDMFNQVGGLTGDVVAEYGISKMENAQEIKALYGLDTPVADISFVYGGKEYYLSISPARQYDSMYYYSVYSDYQDTIVLVPPQNLMFLNYNLEDFYQPQVFQYNINEIASIEAKYGDKVCNYVLEGEAANLKVTEANTQKSIDVPSFRQFYISLMNVTIGGYSSLDGQSTDTLKHELTYTVTFRDSSKLVYEFYSESTMSCYMIADGKGGFKTERRLIEDIVTKSEMLMNGENIVSPF